MNAMPTRPSQTLRDAHGGDLAAFEVLVRHYQGCVCAITLAITRNLAASEEVAQDVFLTAWSRRETLREPESFPSWIRQIARNKSREWLRREGGRHRARVQVDEAAAASAVSGTPGVV